MIKLFFTYTLILIASNSFAQTISGVSGVLSHGQSITISGSSFGAAPGQQIFDNLEDGAADTTAVTGLLNGANWEAINGLAASSTAGDQRHSDSTYQGIDQITTYGTSGYSGGTQYYGDWYVSYWFKLDENWVFGSTLEQYLGNIKIFRFWNTGDESDNLAVVLHTGNLRAGTEGCSGGRLEYGPDVDDVLTRNVWHMIEVEYRESSANDAADGVTRVWIDGKHYQTVSDWVTRCTGAGSTKRVSLAGFYNSTGTGSYYYWQDDTYVVRGWQRVIIGDAADCGGDNPSNCTHREIQPVTAWADTSISITLNRGSFGASDTAYLFIIGSDGTASTGYEITFGDSAPATIPGGITFSGCALH